MRDAKCSFGREGLKVFLNLHHKCIYIEETGNNINYLKKHTKKYTKMNNKFREIFQRNC